MGETLNILLVDDDEMDRMTVRRALRAIEPTASVQEVMTASGALSAMQLERFDCVLMDYNLADCDGLALMREARALGMKSPVIMLTGHGDEQLAVEIMKAGASDYLMKSRVSLENLAQSIQTAVRLHRAEERAAAAVASVVASEERYRTLVFTTSQIVWTADAGGLVSSDQPTWQDFTGQTYDQARGEGWAAVLHHEDRERIVRSWNEAVLLGKAYEAEFRLHRRDGVYRHMLSRGAPVTDANGVVREWIGTCTDITERKEGEQDRARLLAHERAARAEAEEAQLRLCDAKDEAVAANRAKDQFLAVLSHELRTPLTPVLTAVLDLESEPGLSPAVMSALGMVRRNVELEARLIDDLLDLTRISKGRLQLMLGTVDAHALLNSALEICEGDITAKRQSVELSMSAGRHHVGADSARLQQVLWNLIKNAVKFTAENGRIAISTRNDSEGRLQIRIADSGVGIDADALPRIFNAFEQGERSITRQFGGLGLGLAISRALAEAHGGEITAYSEGRGAGATFTLSLPTIDAIEAVSPTVPSRQPDIGISNLRILLVDDHDDTIRSMKKLLERIGHEVRTASSVAGALASADSAPFDLLISDIGLPDGSGMDLVRQLNGRLRTGRPLKAIAISGFGMEEDMRRSREAGFADHLTKPVNFQQLECLMQRLAQSE